MSRIAVFLSLIAVFAPACKKKELQAALDQANATLASTRDSLETETTTRESLQNELDESKARIQQLEERVSSLLVEVDDIAKRAGLSAREVEELRQEREALRVEQAKRQAELDTYKSIFDQLRRLVDAGTIGIEFRKGRMVIKLSNSILFDSGKAKLKPEGLAPLDQLATALGSLGGRDFLIAGHTDNVPIHTARYRTNWELSTARSIAVVNYLIEAGMDPTHLGAAGFAEFDPVADNDTDDGRASNRRIEIILMPALGKISGVQELLQGR